jgi:NCS2 family nucleobase:cation symporter-2
MELAAATGATARIIGLTTAGIFVLLAFLPKVAAVLALIPSPVMGAGLIYVACHLVSSGTELIASRMLDARRIYVIRLPLLAGVGIIAMPDIAGHFPPWAAAVVASPLATATILALVLNLALNAGVSSRASTTIALDANLGETIDRFVERQAATWGARRDVIDRALPAFTDWCEEFRETTDAGSINLGLFFDDFRFVATIRSSDQAEIGALAGSSTLRQTSEMIDQRYGRRTRIGADNAINLTFEH